MFFPKRYLIVAKYPNDANYRIDKECKYVTSIHFRRLAMARFFLSQLHSNAIRKSEYKIQFGIYDTQKEKLIL